MSGVPKAQFSIVLWEQRNNKGPNSVSLSTGSKPRPNATACNPSAALIHVQTGPKKIKNILLWHSGVRCRTGRDADSKIKQVAHCLLITQQQRHGLLHSVTAWGRSPQSPALVKPSDTCSDEPNEGASIAPSHALGHRSDMGLEPAHRWCSRSTSIRKVRRGIMRCLGSAEQVATLASCGTKSKP